MRIPCLHAACVAASFCCAAAQAAPADAADCARAVPQFSSDQVALAIAMRHTSGDALVVALARSMEASHRRLLHRYDAAARPRPALAARTDADYVDWLVDSHSALLERCAASVPGADAAEAARIAGVLRSRIAMAQAMQRELDADGNFYTVLESTD